MDKRFITGVVALAVFLCAAAAYGKVTALAQPGAAEDPLVSKAYVDGQVNQLKSLIGSGGTGGGGVSAADREAIKLELLTYFETLYGEALRVAVTGSADAYEIVQARKGQAIIGRAGSQIILRSGTATAITGENSICDATAGSDLMNGMNIPKNHLLIVPLGDGRGLRCTSDVFLMIKGGYHVAE